MSWRQLWHQFRKNRAAEWSLYLIIGFVLAATLAYQLSPYDPFALGDETLIAPRGDHWMGTDDLGRDTLSRVIHGSRVPLLVGFLATAASMALGILIGSLSGYFGGRTDIILMRVTEYVLVVPRFFLALLVVAMLGTGIEKIILVIGILGWPEVARVVRAQFLTFREREFVDRRPRHRRQPCESYFSGNSPQCDSAGGGGGVDISRAGDSLGGGIKFSRFRRSQPDQLGLAVERSSGTDQRIGLAGAVSRLGDFTTRALHQSVRRRH